MKRIGIVNINLQYEIPDGVDAQEFLENVELPKEYVEDSFEITKILAVCRFCGTLYDEDFKCRCQQ